MIHVGIDIGKLKHCFCILDYSTGEELVTPTFFQNNQTGFHVLSQALTAFSKDSLLIGMEDTGHYHFALLRFLIAQGFSVALMNPTTTDFERRRQGSATKNDKLDTITICDVLASSPHKKKLYRLVTPANFATYEMKQLTRQQGKRITLTAEQLKEAAKVSVGYSSLAEEMNIRHLVAQIELLRAQIVEIDKKIEEFSHQSNSPILTIPGISHFSGTSILAEFGDVRNYDKVSNRINA